MALVTREKSILHLHRLSPPLTLPLHIPKFFRRTILVSPRRWYNFSFVLLLTSFFVGMVVFPERYIIFKFSISALGSPVKNPNGSFWWSAGIVLVSLWKIGNLVLPQILIRPLCKMKMKSLQEILRVSGNIGFAGIAVISEEHLTLHGIFAFFAFLGYTGWLFLKGLRIYENSPSSTLRTGISVILGILVILFLAMLLSLITFQDKHLIFSSDNVNFSFFEWLLFLWIFLADIIFSNGKFSK